ncbi:zf-HC2 domain-containing protein [Microbispora cellulosiformans]|uniref:Zf-HC2 domain-containing protein n=1 Tax=Microbispora cellulosiformans TaxID=2614688 RepID=A0A5J5JXY1_9ACTN|nr:zf-HC2 domain-containing protein [Microbispora cellulosiformans]KAA9376524.1 zf-HC2 domain-containing protein [Microbispora cellulosiformans]
MTDGDWHIPPGLLERYLEGALDPVNVMSLEAHLVRCDRCRTAVPADEAWLAASWRGVSAEIARPRPSPAERALRRAGVPEHLAKLLVATPALSRAWAASVAVALAFAVTAAHLTDEGFLVFLTLAPVLPTAGIALAYGRWADPAYETYAATPMAGAPLLLVRSVAVLLTAVALTTLAVPLLPAATAAWLLPALALSTGCLALATRVPLPVAAAVLAGGWPLAVTAVGLATDDRALPFRPAAQVLYGGVAALLALALYVRRHRLDPAEPR